MTTAPAPRPVVGRFAPSPSGRMHLGNVFTALLSWLSARAAGGRWVLRIEDLDPQRSKAEHARAIEDDLLWLGLEWDEGGLADRGPNGPYSQSRRGHIYAEALERLHATGMTYGCRCTRAELMATQAPHQSDGRMIYPGTCRPAVMPRPEGVAVGHGAVRLYAPHATVSFTDGVYGPQQVDLASECGDFILRRADGAWAYQLAVVVDDALMGVTQVVRGNDLLTSAAQQIHIYRLLGRPEPQFIHLPLIVSPTDGRRLSKRHPSLNMEQLRRDFTPQQLLGRLAFMAGITSTAAPVDAAGLIPQFDINKIPRVPVISA